MKKTSPNIEHITTDSLVPYARNAKKHDPSQVGSIAASIKEFGFNNPVLIDKDNGIIAGHGRVLAAQKLGLESVPCLRLSHLTDNQKRAYILADNRLAEMGGGWDAAMLHLEMDEVNFDTLGGFSLADLGGLETIAEGGRALDPSAFFAEPVTTGDGDGQTERIILEYPADQCAEVREQLTAHGDTPEAAILALLNSNKD